MIKAIIFDWGGVLIEDPTGALMSYCASELSLDKEKFKKEYYKYEKSFQKNHLTEVELWRKICKNLGTIPPKSGSIWRKAVQKIFKENKKVMEIARRLKEQGYLLGFLSNTEVVTAEYFRKQRYNIFDVAVFSCFEGFVKPEKEIYKIALNRLKVKPEEAIFIDDKEEHVKGAREVGIRAILFRDAKHLIRDLKRLSIKLTLKNLT